MEPDDHRQLFVAIEDLAWLVVRVHVLLAVLLRPALGRALLAYPRLLVVSADPTEHVLSLRPLHAAVTLDPELGSDGHPRPPAPLAQLPHEEVRHVDTPCVRQLAENLDA